MTPEESVLIYCVVFEQQHPWAVAVGSVVSVIIW